MTDAPLKPCPEPTESANEAEARIMQEWRWGNLTKLGVANHLRRAGFNLETACRKANALTRPDPAPTGEVTQGDREAAASNILKRLIAMHGGEQPWMDASTQSMRMGEQDAHWEVQAFRNHRLRAVAPLESEIARLRQRLELTGEFADGPDGIECRDDTIKLQDERIARQEATIAQLTELLDELQTAESTYRYAHDILGAGDRKTGRAWDLMRRAGDRARLALSPDGDASEGGGL